MDQTSRQLVSYVRSFSGRDLTESALNGFTDRMVDSVACLIAGFDSEPARIAVRMTKAIRAERGATVFGAGVRTAPDLAAFANSVMVRAYDYNDGGAGGHPSDMIPA